MSYKTINQCANDSQLYERIMGAIAQEQNVRDEVVEPSRYVNTLRWEVATASDVEEAYAYAIETDNPSPGGDETVITDGMILAVVQANWPEAPIV